MNRLTALLVLLSIAALGGCAAQSSPAATVTVTAEPSDDAWQRFREEPKNAFVFASAYEIIWGTPIGNGENADAIVELSDTMCDMVASGYVTWDTVGDKLEGIDTDDPETREKIIATAKVFCREVD